MNGGIYSITNKINGKRCIGSTIQKFEIRWKEHIKKLDSKTHYNPHLQSSWIKYGKDNFKFEIICHNFWNSKKLREIENLFINLYKTRDNRFGYNKRSAGEVVEFNEETRKRMADSHKGEKGFWFGKKLPEEVKEKISKANRGNFPSEETRKKLSESHKTENLTEETRKKLSESHKTENLTKEVRKKISEGVKGDKNGMFGKHRFGNESPMFGKNHTEEAKKKMSETRKGRNPSDETKKKMSESRKGRTCPNKGKKLNKETGHYED